MEKSNNCNYDLNLVDIQEGPDQEEDALSLCDLPLTPTHPNYQDLHSFEYPPNSPSRHDFFEFLTFDNTATGNSGIVFCGRNMSYREPTKLQEGYEVQRPNPFLQRSDSFIKSRALLTSNSSKPSSGSLRKHKVVFGVAKIPTRMELSDMRRRQSRRDPAPMFPAVGCGGGEVVVGCSGGGRGSHWGLLRPLRCRAHLASVLARASFGCLSHARMFEVVS